MMNMKMMVKEIAFWTMGIIGTVIAFIGALILVMAILIWLTKHVYEPLIDWL